MPIFDAEFGKTAIIMCYIANPDGTMVSGCARSILKQSLEKMKKQGFSKLNIGFEPEFFLLKKKPKHSKDYSTLLDFGDYADVDIENDATSHVRQEIMHELEKTGIIPLLSHHERAPSSCEIPYRYSDAMTSCDNLLLGMLITKLVAKKHGLFATFEPKPLSKMNGNGLHTNISLCKNEKNAFASENGLSSIAKNFTYGILSHAEEFSFLTNPTKNSYKRLVKGYEAPVNITWGYHNRTAMIRIPSASENATRIEVRSPDCTMNPYLGVAAMLLAGMDGIENNEQLNDFDFNEKARKKNTVKSLPSSVAKAKKLFEGSSFYKSLFEFDAFCLK